LKMLTTGETITVGKLIITGLVLGAAAIMDVRYRRVPDRFWLLLSAAVGPLLIWQIAREGGSGAPGTFLILSLPIGGMLFALYGYPEFGEVIKGKREDLIFTFLYAALAICGIAAFFSGDRSVVVKVFYSFVFMMVYFLLYSVSIGGIRVIHGGADAKCLMALAALYPWYGEMGAIGTGPFYGNLSEVSAMEFIFPFHLSTMLNAAVITVLFLALYLPIKNIMAGKKDPLKMFTGYSMDIRDTPGKHVWIYVEEDGKKRKADPDEATVSKLTKEGKREVRVTPKIPFILSMVFGFLLQVSIGNVVLWVMLSV